MNRHRRTLLSGLALMLAGGFAAAAAGGAQAQDKTTIRIGQLVHVTGAFAAGMAGVPEGFLDGIEAANQHMDMPGFRLEGFNVDGGSDTAKSTEAFKLMTDGQNSIAVLVGASTPVDLALKVWNIRKKIPNITGGSDDELLKLPSYTFSVTTPYVNQVGAWIDYYMTEVWPKKNLNRAPRFAWLTWENAFGRAAITPNTIEYIKSRGIEIVGEEFIPLTPTDVGAQVLRLKEKGVDFTAGSMYHNALAVVLKEMDKNGLIDQIDIGMTYATNPEALMASAGKLSRNVHITGAFWNFPAWGERAPHYLEYYNKRSTPPSQFGYAAGFSHALIAAEAVRLAAAEVGPANVNGEAVYNALQKMTGFDAWGIGPAHNFSETKRYSQDAVLMFGLDGDLPKMMKEQATPQLTGVR
jgi:ABC-type branched-subunit amino acid transport system substrate-binding protein